MTDEQYLRGTVWEYAFEDGAAPEPGVIVSNNGRNRSRWPTVHVVRVTTAPKPQLETIVELGHHEGIKGRIICDDLTFVFKEHLGKRMGALTPGTMRVVDRALKAVLALR
ncbi:MAG: type II toxin-antitoxin system PemK/MazF family toxin [Acidimicrobiia bacterium]